MLFSSPHAFHLFSESASHLQFSLFFSRDSPGRCYACGRQSFLFEFGYTREILPPLEPLIPPDYKIDLESEVDFQNFLLTRFYLRVFCENSSCLFEGCVVFCETPLDLARRLVGFGELLETFDFPFATLWQSEIRSALDNHALLFFGTNCEETDLPPSTIVEVEFPDSESDCV